MIKFKNVTQQFPDGTIAFSDLSFTIEDGELALIVGPSGSGKTTILNLLIKEFQPTEGKIFFNEILLEKLKTKNLPQHRRKIGIVFQDYKLIEELNVWENIALPLFIQGLKLSDIEERVTDLLKLVELTNKSLVFPKQLSGGEAQRISIARALATGPSIIFADEPTGNLDSQTSRHILDLLKKINKLGTTLIIATHDPVIIDEMAVKKIDLASQKHEIDSDAKQQLPKNIKHQKTKLPYKQDGTNTSTIKPEKIKIKIKKTNQMSNFAHQVQSKVKAIIPNSLNQSSLSFKKNSQENKTKPMVK